MKALCSKTLLLLVSIGNYSLAQAADSATTNSVFRVVVSTKERPNVPTEGSGFVVHVEGNPENPVVYVLTAAHVILGLDAGDDTKLMDVVESVAVRFSNAAGDTWPVDPRGIRIAPQWESSGRDFALLKVISAGRKVSALPLGSKLPNEGAQFEAAGFPPNLPRAVTVRGRTIGSPGAYSAEPWILVDAALTPGMSGGPALSDGHVFAVVQGRPKNVPELKFLAPLSLITGFLRDNVPGIELINTQGPNGGFEAHAYAIGRRVTEHNTSEAFEVRSGSMNVGCGESREVSVSYPLTPDLTVISHNANWANVDNIKSATADSSASPIAVTGKGQIFGLDKQFLNCPGGGHATLVVGGRVNRRSTQIENTSIEFGASEIWRDTVTFSIPKDENLRIDSLRVDIRPLGSQGRFSPIRLNGLGASPVEQNIFGKTFKLGVNSGNLLLTLF